MIRHLAAATVLVLVSAAGVAAQPTIILVRHAERADAATGGPAMTANDPDLSAAGRARAETLARMLKDAKVTAIFTTEYRRTQQTAAPLAKAIGVTPAAVPSKDVAGLIGKLESAQGVVLVVGHSNTIPEIIKSLGIAEPLTIGDGEFDNLFVVQRATLLRLRY